MKQNIKDILKVKIYKNELKKSELKRKILKSIVQNKMLDPKIRFFSKYKLSKLNKFNKFNRFKKICILSGKYKSIINLVNLSRHQFKKLNLTSKIANIKIK
uniref:ribosomal protein S14 n=1 Tax=Cryptocaryon irritans TaxID=153251 RepID=UPI0022FDA58B|nr:ribosomal protein S14 [Cryptocaryon irritans]WBP62321.1 ribosomal protein S14 [Cryptocaryon irritans]